VFFGTPGWAVPSLRAIGTSEAEIVAVVTNPDRPAGRGYEVAASPVKTAALGAGLQVVQPASARDPGFADWLREAAPDVCAVVAYGKILPAELLSIPSKGFVNLHFSLLPAYRGAAPVQRAVMDGLDATGLSIMVLTEGMDEGPVLASLEVEIGSQETAGELGERLADAGAPLLTQTLRDYVAGDLVPVEQDHTAATYAPKITSEEARIDWNRPGTEIANLVRGLNPAPGAWTTFGDLRLKIHRATPMAASMGESAGPGSVIDPATLVVGAGQGCVRLDIVQPAGKKPMPGEVFARGARIPNGALLG
jgi:methionyl-tRNA formyltransferase